MSHKYFRKRQYSTAIKYPGTTPLEGGDFSQPDPRRAATPPKPGTPTDPPRPGRADADHTPTRASPPGYIRPT
ncbi:hypothetical protein NJB1604_24810 [Mycobacterium marinum]|nr:hypothetical protein NJB1604_24810 [Mycobacterium marinum]